MSGARKSDDDANSAEMIHIAESETAGHRQIDLTTEQVRQGHTGDHVRYILMTSTFGVVVAFAIAALIFMR